MRPRDNPFAVQRIHALRYRLDEPGWRALEARLARLGHRAALVGPDGSGKTTLLEELGARLAVRGFALRRATLRRGERRLAPAAERALLAGLTPRDLLLVDGADALGLLAWRRVARRSCAAGGLLITSHRPGLLPTLREHATTPELLADLIAELLGAGVPPPVSPRQLFRRHGGNLRDALGELYDFYAGRHPVIPLGVGSSRDVPGGLESATAGAAKFRIAE
jgi:hypothetical protein